MNHQVAKSQGHDLIRPFNRTPTYRELVNYDKLVQADSEIAPGKDPRMLKVNPSFYGKYLSCLESCVTFNQLLVMGEWLNRSLKWGLISLQTEEACQIHLSRFLSAMNGQKNKLDGDLTEYQFVNDRDGKLKLTRRSEEAL